LFTAERTADLADYADYTDDLLGKKEKNAKRQRNAEKNFCPQITQISTIGKN